MNEKGEKIADFSMEKDVQQVRGRITNNEKGRKIHEAQE